METAEIIKVAVGIFFVIYGLGFNIYEKFHGMKFIDQKNGVINGKLCIAVGVYVAAYTLNVGIAIGIVAFTLLILEESILYKKRQAFEIKGC